MGHARNASSGDKHNSWHRAWTRSRQERGVPVAGVTRRRWHKEGTGSNRSGLLTGNVPWENKKGAKRSDTQSNVANAARQQAVAEQTADALDDQDIWDHPFRVSAEEAGLDSLADMPPGVTFNGEPAEHYAYSDDYWEHEYQDNFTSRLAQEMAENARLREEITALRIQVAALKMRYES